MVFLVIGIYIVTLVFDFSQLNDFQNKLKGFIVYSVLLSFGFFISVLLALDKQPISPSEIIERIVNLFK